MPYDEAIDARVRKIVGRWKGTGSKKMFGGVCHLMNGNMLGGVIKDMLILRLGVDAAEAMLKEKHCRPFDITGKAMKGWVMVEKPGFSSDERLRELLNQAKTFVKTLPPK